MFALKFMLGFGLGCWIFWVFLGLGWFNLWGFGVFWAGLFLGVLVFLAVAD
jgi:hypothetical protein